jgi:hypothetical protein
MKRIKLLCVGTLLFTISVNAQITKGNWMVGGDASFNNSKVINDKDEIIGSGNGIRIFPNIGYFLIDKFAVGINGNFNYGKTNGSPSSIGYGGGPFARYYFLKPEKTVNVFAEANYNYYTSKTQGFDSTNGSSYRFKAGPVIYFNSSVGLELTLNDSTEKFSNYTSKYFTVGFGFQIHLEK